MKEKKGVKTKTKFIATEIVLSIFVVIIICAMIIDFSRPITYSEVSKAGLKAYVGAEEEANGKRTKVKANYLDLEGNELAPSDEVEGFVGDEYKFPDKKISGYRLATEGYAKTGNFQDTDMEVDFIYKNSNENVDIANGDASNITVRMKSQKQTSEYNLKIITKDEEGNLIKGVSYNVSKDNDLMRSGKVQGNTFVAGTIVISKEGTDKFTIEENSGYYYDKLVNGNVEFSLNKNWIEDEGLFEVSLDYDKTMKGVNIEIKDKDIIVTITNKLRPVINEKGEGKFDLEITKYISKVVIDNGKATKEIERTIENKDSLLKLEIDAKEISKTKVTITYNLLVKNVGSIPGYATELTDYIPENFVLNQNEDWIEAERVAITNKLAGKLLNPGEEVELPITFDWNITDSTMGYRENKAEITIYSNKDNIKDFTPDNIDGAGIIVTIKTGAVRTISLGVLVSLIIVACVIYKEKIKE